MIVPLGSTFGFFNKYVICQLKSQRGTCSRISDSPVGYVTLYSMLLPRKCMCGRRFTTVRSRVTRARAGYRIIVNARGNGEGEVLDVHRVDALLWRILRENQANARTVAYLFPDRLIMQLKKDHGTRLDQFGFPGCRSSETLPGV